MRLPIASLVVTALLATGCGDSEGSAPSNTMPSAADHTARDFPITAGTSHGPAAGQASADCNGCHYDKAAAAPSATFRVYTCTRCHVLLGNGTFHDDPQAVVQAWHEAAGVNDFAATVAAANVVGVAPIDAACRSCHPDGTGAAPSNHEQLFPRAAGTAHQGIGCAQCHGTGLKTDLDSLQCAGCHNAIAGFGTKHAAIGGIAILNLYTNHVLTGTVPLTSPNCLKCHADSQVDRIASHTTREEGFGRSEHRPAGCISCHATTRPASEKPYPAVNFTWPSGPSRSSSGCATSCHNAVGNN
jgi:hypothetical protein